MSTDKAAAVASRPNEEGCWSVLNEQLVQVEFAFQMIVSRRGEPSLDPG